MTNHQKIAADTITDLLAAVRGRRASDPNVTVDDLVTLMETTRDHLLPPAEAPTSCRHCGRGIWQSVDGRWRHDDPDHSRGCRAAMFDDDPDGWHASTTRAKAAP